MKINIALLVALGFKLSLALSSTITMAHDRREGSLPTCERILARVKKPQPPGYKNSKRAALAQRGFQAFVQRMMNIKGPEHGVYGIGLSPEHVEFASFLRQTPYEVVVTRADLIAAALRSPDLIDRGYSNSPTLVTKAGADSILLLPDSDKESADKWRLAHKALAPFFRPKYLEEVVGPKVRANAEALVENWLRKRNKTVTVNQDLEHYALNNVFSPLFEQPLVAPLSKELTQALRMFFGPSTPDEAVEARQLFEALVKPSVELTLNGKGSELLQQLRAVQKDEGLPESWIYDQLITVYFAGQVTTKTMLTMALYHLTEYPKYQEQLRKEYRTWREGGGRLDLTRAFIQETLRLYPPVPILHRYTTQNVRLGGYVIPKHTPVVLNMYAGFLRPEVWGPTPEEFRPERFFTQSIGRHDLCVFGSGPRICIGQHLALQEAEVLLGELLSRASVERSGDFEVPSVENAGVLHVHSDLRVKLKPL